METSAKTGACYTGHIGATVLSEVRAISGLPPHRNPVVWKYFDYWLDFNRPQRIFGSSDCFEACWVGLK